MDEKYEELIEGLNFQADMARDFGEDEPEPEDLDFSHLLRRSASALKLLLAENSRLKEALKPFAAISDEIDEDWSGTASIVPRRGAFSNADELSTVNIEDIRAARAALNGEPS